MVNVKAMCRHMVSSSEHLGEDGDQRGGRVNERWIVGLKTVYQYGDEENNKRRVGWRSASDDGSKSLETAAA